MNAPRGEDTKVKKSWKKSLRDIDTLWTLSFSQLINACIRTTIRVASSATSLRKAETPKLITFWVPLFPSEDASLPIFPSLYHENAVTVITRNKK